MILEGEGQREAAERRKQHWGGEGEEEEEKEEKQEEEDESEEEEDVDEAVKISWVLVIFADVGQQVRQIRTISAQLEEGADVQSPLPMLPSKASWRRVSSSSLFFPFSLPGSLGLLPPPLIFPSARILPPAHP